MKSFLRLLTNGHYNPPINFRAILLAHNFKFVLESSPPGQIFISRAISQPQTL